MSGSKYKNIIEISVRAVITYGGKILVCRLKDKGYYFFPGGHVEFNETLRQALRREMREELGLRIRRADLIGMIENRYQEAGLGHHEINFVFAVITERIKNLKTKEAHLDFVWLSSGEFAKIKVYPVVFQRELKKWVSKKKFFLASGGTSN